MKTIAGDDHALWRIEGEHPGPIQVKRRVTGGRIVVPQRADGYALSWGQIVESHRVGVSLWDFYFDEAAFPMEDPKNDLTAIQALVFDALELSLDCVSRTFMTNSDVLAGEGWQIIPGGLNTGSLFTVVTPYARHQECRVWMVTELIPEIVPSIIESVRLQRQAYGM